jgi:hypothetical protein
MRYLQEIGVEGGRVEGGEGPGFEDTSVGGGGALGEALEAGGDVQGIQGRGQAMSYLQKLGVEGGRVEGGEARAERLDLA